MLTGHHHSIDISVEEPSYSESPAPCSQQSSPWAGGLGRGPWTGTRTPWRSTPGEGDDDDDDDDDDGNDDDDELQHVLG